MYVYMCVYVYVCVYVYMYVCVYVCLGLVVMSLAEVPEFI